MEKNNFSRRILEPVLIVFAVMVLSYCGYFGSRNVSNVTLNQAMAAIFGTSYFLSIAFGTFYVYTTVRVMGGSLPEGVFASAINPFIWMTKEVIVLTHSFPIIECVYYYLNPLNFWLIFFITFQTGVAEVTARWVLKKRGVRLKIVTAAPVVAAITGLALLAAGYAWGKGENIYVIFLDGYRKIFGPWI
ncbi:MAG TPA: hypothetical protein ENN21_02345 [Spirochaetes bacterium]|nr:hypothetical protein [Spirochaetota bacterium]